ncbi:MAG: cobalt ECF transporter T component CbiQ [Chloroflexi bacterium]|nr:MAG: cobalt ECF transporter T component CbiQ [Chloroflexota bacterium]
MHINTFDRYEVRESLIHHLEARVKVVITVLFIFSNVLLPDGAWAAFLLSWGLLLGVNLLARLPWHYALKRSFIALPFALAAVTVVFTLPGEVVFTLRPGPWVWTATDAGLVRFASIVVRSWLSVQMAILLTATTPFPDMMHALRHLRAPSLLVAVISFMYRYLFVLADEAIRLLRAREARSARLPGRKGGGSLWWRARVAGNMVGQLFLRSYERSDRVYNAMLARGYRGYIQTINPHQMRGLDWVAGGAAVLLLLVIQAVGILLR